MLKLGAQHPKNVRAALATTDFRDRPKCFAHVRSRLSFFLPYIWRLSAETLTMLHYRKPDNPWQSARYGCVRKSRGTIKSRGLSMFIIIFPKSTTDSYQVLIIIFHHFPQNPPILLFFSQWIKRHQVARPTTRHQVDLQQPRPTGSRHVKLRRFWRYIYI